ncbi:hypothetical protein [Rhodopseudomonas sp. BAL398]|nr:hypothetical protein [Rhodopseudomonas sp. BAL398]MDF3810898.1 hypothetical protein [Rhodopseudomonas sp. BAL398]WOK19327.1 hypothetical protein RBJ75_07375 [Rhodopseudomonas sp. BAL398]
MIALNAVHPAHVELFAASRLKPQLGILYGAADLSLEQGRALLTLPEI